MLRRLSRALVAVTGEQLVGRQEGDETGGASGTSPDLLGWMADAWSPENTEAERTRRGERIKVKDTGWDAFGTDASELQVSRTPCPARQPESRW